MAKKRNRRRRSQTRGGVDSSPQGGSIDLIGDDLLQNILSRLPALSFASAACVNRSWSTICNRVLSRPKLSSALSLNSSQQDAVNEVLDKVLSEPIRPHFAIASIGPCFDLHRTHKLITGKLGSTTPVVTSVSYGIMGRDALTDEFKEMKWEITEDEEVNPFLDLSLEACNGIVLTVGYFPGLKVGAVPLLQSDEESRVLMVDDFVMDIRQYTTSVSGSTSPSGIIMFGDRETDMTPILDKMDYAMSMKTVIVGDGGSRFLYGGNCRNTSDCQYNTAAAVVLLFARDTNKPHGIGETQFHITLSTGVSPIGPTYKAASVRNKYDGCFTWLTARREGLRENLDGQTILNHIYGEMGDRIQYPAFYIGVTKRRKCFIGSDKVRWITSQAFHEVQGGDEEYLYVSDVGIKTGDTFRFYYSDSNTASSSCNNVCDYFGCLKQDCNAKNCLDGRADMANGNKKEVFGGLIFSCCGRGESFFECPNVDSFPFLDSFPGVTLAGMFCGGEIGRGDLSAYCRESREQSSVRCCLHVFSTVYLVMSYTRALPEH